MSAYAIADLHGRYDLWRLVLDSINPEDLLIFLGDAIDRTDLGILIIDELRKRPNTVYLKGNHEQLMEMALPGIIECRNDELKFEIAKRLDADIKCWFKNGGDVTWATLTHKTDKELNDYIQFCKNLPITYTYVNTKGQTIICNHCGFTPNVSYEAMWSRAHFEDDWPLGYENTYIVHGHTPKQLMNYYEAGSYRYANGHKIDLDTYALGTDELVLLNLDTLEEKIIINKI